MTLMVTDCRTRSGRTPSRPCLPARRSRTAKIDAEPWSFICSTLETAYLFYKSFARYTTHYNTLKPFTLSTYLPTTTITRSAEFRTSTTLSCARSKSLQGLQTNGNIFYVVFFLDIQLQRCRDPEKRVNDPSKSIEMSSFDRAHMTSY